MFNKITLVGRLTKDPEMRYTPNGTPVASFTLAVDRSFVNKQGEKESDFIPVVVWNKLAENCVNYSGKGRLVLVEGRLQIRPYTDKEGTKRKIAEAIASNVKFLDWPKEKTGESIPDSTSFGESEISFTEEEIPF